MAEHLNRSRLVVSGRSPTPLGQLHLASFLDDSRGAPARPMHVLGSYALILLLEGKGSFCDGNGYRQKTQAGDAIFVFPDVAHWYGPGQGEYWNEFFVIFDGPQFDLLRSAGVLDVARPVCRLAPIEKALQQLLDVFGASPLTPAEATLEIGRFAAVLMEFALRESQSSTGENSALLHWQHPRWSTHACALMEGDLSCALNKQHIACEVGMSFDTFRKRFKLQTGLSPAAYREARRIKAACAMLHHGNITNKEIARSLGFSDEFHFSKRFTQLMKITPKEFRSRARMESRGENC